MIDYKRTAENLTPRQRVLLMALYDKPQTWPELSAAGYQVQELDALWTQELATINSQDRYYLTECGLNVRRFTH